MSFLIDNMFYLTCGMVSLTIAQLLKPFFGIFMLNKFDMALVFSSGRFPSSHTSFIIAVTLAIGLVEGFDSSSFALGVVLSLIIMYDAMNVRLYAGRNIELTKQLISDLKELDFKFNHPIYIRKAKEVLGHSSIEVLGGFIVGVAVTLVLYNLR